MLPALAVPSPLRPTPQPALSRGLLAVHTLCAVQMCLSLPLGTVEILIQICDLPSLLFSPWESLRCARRGTGMAVGHAVPIEVSASFPVWLEEPYLALQPELWLKIFMVNLGGGSAPPDCGAERIAV